MNLSFKEKLSLIAGQKAYEESLLKVRKGDILTFIYTYQITGKKGRTFTIAFRLSSLINFESTLSEVEQFCLKSLHLHVSYVFCRTVRFVKVRFKLNDVSHNEFLLNNCYGKIDQMHLQKGLQMEVRMSSGKKQKITINGSTKRLFSWDVDDNDYTDYLLNFSTLFNEVIKFKEEAFLRCIGFHTQNYETEFASYVTGVVPLCIQEPQVKKRKVEKPFTGKL